MLQVRDPSLRAKHYISFIHGNHFPSLPYSELCAEGAEEEMVAPKRQGIEVIDKILDFNINGRK